MPRLPRSLALALLSVTLLVPLTALPSVGSDADSYHNVRVWTVAPRS